MMAIIKNKSHSRIRVALVKKLTEESRLIQFRLELENFIDSSAVFRERGISALVRMNFYRHLTARLRDDDSENALLEYLHELRLQKAERNAIAGLIFDELLGFVKNCDCKDETLFLVFCFVGDLGEKAEEVVEIGINDKRGGGLTYSIINGRGEKKK